MNILHLSAKQLRRAATIKVQLSKLQRELNRLLGDESEGSKAPRKRRKMSAAGRARIAAAQRARWAKRGSVKSAKAAARPRRKISVAARKHLARLAKARWAKAKAAGRKGL